MFDVTIKQCRMWYESTLVYHTHICIKGPDIVLFCEYKCLIQDPR